MCEGCSHHDHDDVAASSSGDESGFGALAGLAGQAIDRRELLKRGGLAAAALLLAACAGASDSLSGLGSGGTLTVKLSDYPALANANGVALVNANVAVANVGGSYVALSRVCPHQGGQITTGGSGFFCPVHGATFNSSGTWIGGQRTSNMRRLSVTTNADGTLTIG